MPTILDALKIKDGGNTPANTITDFLRAHNDAPLTNGDVTIASYIANSPTYDPVAPVPSNDSQGLVKGIITDATSRTYTRAPKSYAGSDYTDEDMQGIYYFSVQNLSGITIDFPEEGEDYFFVFTDANDVQYRVPGAFTYPGGPMGPTGKTGIYANVIVPNRNRLSAYSISHKSNTSKPIMFFVVCIPWETASSITIKRFEWHKVTKL